MPSEGSASKIKFQNVIKYEFSNREKKNRDKKACFPLIPLILSIDECDARLTEKFKKHANKWVIRGIP
jgi:hypothetical protein